MSSFRIKYEFSQGFCLLMAEKTKEMDTETHFKDTFRVFSKDEEGKIYYFLN